MAGGGFLHDSLVVEHVLHQYKNNLIVNLFVTVNNREPFKLPLGTTSCPETFIPQGPAEILNKPPTLHSLNEKLLANKLGFHCASINLINQFTNKDFYFERYINLAPSVTQCIYETYICDVKQKRTA